jgi:PII-like signaling protein
MGITVYLGDIGYQEQGEKHETAVLQTRNGPISITVGTKF